jgi:UDP-glucose 4-epimerase
MNILVTGGLGFIGSHTVVELANAGFNPIILDNLDNSELLILEGIEKILNKKVPFLEGDCNNKELMQGMFLKYDIKGIIHFAAYKAVGESVQNPLKYYYNNLNSLITVLEVANDFGVTDFVFSSSATVYGDAQNLPVNEQSSTPKAASPYGNTKQIGEEILQDVAKAMPFKAIALRYFNPIGASKSGFIGELPIGVPNNLVPFVTQTAIGLRTELQVFGDDYNTPDGTCLRDYIHVVDLAKAHVKALEYLRQQNNYYFEAMNVGTGTPTSVLEVVKGFEEVTNQPLNYKIVARRSGDVAAVYADVTKIHNKLGWKAEYDTKQALLDAWNWQVQLKAMNFVSKTK